MGQTIASCRLSTSRALARKRQTTKDDGLSHLSGLRTYCPSSVSRTFSASCMGVKACGGTPLPLPDALLQNHILDVTGNEHDFQPGTQLDGRFGEFAPAQSPASPRRSTTDRSCPDGSCTASDLRVRCVPRIPCTRERSGFVSPMREPGLRPPPEEHSPCRWARVAIPAGSSALGCTFSATAGRKTLKVVPSPTWTRHRMAPPLCSTMPSTVAKPRPVPLPVSLVVKNGSKMCFCISASMPTPVSPTVSSHVAAGREVLFARFGLPSG